MGKVLSTIGIVVALVGVTILTGGIATGGSIAAVLGTGLGIGGLTVGSLFIGAAVLSFAGSLLQGRPSVPSTSGSMTDRLKVTIDARAPRRICFGRTALAIDLRDQEFSSDQQYLHRFLVHAAHKIGGIDEYWFDDKKAWDATSGVTSDFAGYFTSTALTVGNAGNAINIGPRMGSSRRYTGCAYSYMRFKLTGNDKSHDSPFAQSVPSRITVRGRGAYLYDPRLDSTVPGGSGPMRADDQASWIAAGWSDDRCRNPALQLLWYLLGWRIQNPVTGQWILSVGKGIAPARIDLPSFIAAANLCDEPVTLAAGGTQPRYRSDGVFSEGDDPKLVIDNLKAAMNADLDDVNGKLRVFVLHNDLGTPVTDFTDDDILDEFTWQQTLALNDQFNIVRGGYTDPGDASLYQQVDYPEVAIASRDGIDRIETINFPLVESAAQAQRLAKQRLQRNLYGGTFKARFQITAWRARRLDVVRLSFRALGWTTKLFRIAEREIDFAGQVTLLLREEHPDLYLWDADERAPVQAVAPTTYDQRHTPVALSLDAIGADATTAQLDADAALSGLNNLGNDGVLTTTEKIQRLIPLNTDLANSFTLLDASAASLSGYPAVASARATADAAWAAWTVYRDALSPAWNNTALDTAVVRATYNGKLNDLQYAIDQLAEALRQANVAAGSFTLRNIAGTTVGANIITKTSADGWNSGRAASVESYVGVGYAAARLSRDQMIGITNDPGAILDPIYQAITYAIHQGGDDHLYARVNGAIVHDFGAYPEGKIAAVYTDGSTVTFIAPDGALYQVSPVVAGGTLLYAVGVAYYQGSSITDIVWSAVGPAGSAGAPGYSINVATTSIIVEADYAGATKDGQVPRTIAVKIFRGADDITGSATASITASNATLINASYGSGTLAITRADTAGYVDVTWQVAGTTIGQTRVGITRKLDNTPPAGATSQSSAMPVSGIPSSYAQIGPVLTVAANGSGQLRGELYLPYSPSTNGYFYAAAKLAIRVAGSGAAFSDLSAEQLGSESYKPVIGPDGEPTGDPYDGSVSIAQTFGGLTAGQSYEVTTFVRRGGGVSSGVALGGSLTVRQP